MKKKAWFLMLGLLLGLLMTSTAWADDCSHSRSDHFVYDENDPEVHGWVCDDCGYYEYIDHIPLCTKPGVCAICGIPCDDSNGEWHITSHTHIYHDSSKHWIECADCGATWNERIHGFLCTDSDQTKCHDCGISKSEASSWDDYHPNKFLTYENNADKHWFTCANCGRVSTKQDHYYYCTSSDAVCARCGAPTNNIQHLSYVVEHDETSHWRVCNECGEVILGPEPHEGTCIQKNVCYWCGSPCSGEKWFHSKTHIEHDEKYHWYVCADCGKVTRTPEMHRGTCVQKDICHSCGVPCSSSEWIHENTHMEHDETTCWPICDDCGEILWGPDLHVGSCIQKNVCVFCGAQFSGDSWSHSYHIEYDETTCWDICVDCGEILRGPDPHEASSDDPTVCKHCGMFMPGYGATTTDPTPGTSGQAPAAVWDASIGKLTTPDNPTYTGFADFEGGKFYIKDGQQCTDYVGPVQINGTFYAFDQGRLQTENMMMAFEGGLFAFNGGTLRTDLIGLAAYDGEQFVFDHGQYQHQACGPYLDPISGKWVYVNYGQFYPITDLVSYDGEIFYFVDGFLATGYTGIVYDFNNTGFYIASGQHYKITDLVSCNGEVLYVVDGKFASWYTGVVEDFKGTQLNVVNGKVVQ